MKAVDYFLWETADLARGRMRLSEGKWQSWMIMKIVDKDVMDVGSG